MQGFPVRFVVRFTALPVSGAWEATLCRDGSEGANATATGSSPEDALRALVPQVLQRPVLVR